MYINAMHIRSTRDSLKARADAKNFREKLREWRNNNPDTPDHEMPNWLAEMKVKADASATHNINTQAAKSAMDLFPPER